MARPCGRLSTAAAVEEKGEESTMVDRPAEAGRSVGKEKREEEEVIADGCKINSETFVWDSRTDRWANRRPCGTGWRRYCLKDERPSIIRTQYRTYSP